MRRILIPKDKGYLAKKQRTNDSQMHAPCLWKLLRWIPFLRNSARYDCSEMLSIRLSRIRIRTCIYCTSVSQGFHRTITQMGVQGSSRVLSTGGHVWMLRRIVRLSIRSCVSWLCARTSAQMLDNCWPHRCIKIHGLWFDLGSLQLTQNRVGLSRSWVDGKESRRHIECAVGRPVHAWDSRICSCQGGARGVVRCKVRAQILPAHATLSLREWSVWICSCRNTQWRKHALPECLCFQIHWFFLCACHCESCNYDCEGSFGSRELLLDWMEVCEWNVIINLQIDVEIVFNFFACVKYTQACVCFTQA